VAGPSSIPLPKKLIIYLKILRYKRPGAQFKWVHLPSKCEPLSSNSSTAPTKKEKEKEKQLFVFHNETMPTMSHKREWQISNF
jgi:hypothetical protein